MEGIASRFAGDRECIAGAGAIILLVLFSAALPVAHALTRVAALSLTPPEEARSAVIDSEKGFAYFGIGSFAYFEREFSGSIVKVQLSDFTRVSTLTLNPGESNLTSALIDTSRGFAYFGTDTHPGLVVRVRLSDFTHAGTLRLNPGEDRLLSALIDAPSGYAYFGTGTTPAKVVKINLSDFTRVDSVTMSTGEDEFTSAVIDSSSGFAYFGTNTRPGAIVKIRLSDFTRVESLRLNLGEDSLASAVIDTAHGFAYFGTGTLFEPGTIVKIRLSDFNRVGSLTMSEGENNLSLAVIDPVNGFAYYGTGWPVQPGTVVQIRLSDFTRVDGLTLSSGEGSLRTAVIDAANRYAYFAGTAIVKLSLVAPPPTAPLVSAFPFGTIGLAVFAAAAVSVSSILIIARRRRTYRTGVLPSAETVVSTGLPELDKALAGGLPQKYAVLLVSPQWDELDLLIQRTIQASISNRTPTFYLSHDSSKAQKIATSYSTNLYAFRPQADKISSNPPNLFDMPTFDNLTELNITLSKTIADTGVQAAEAKLFIIEILSDMLLRHRPLTTRKWLSGFLAKRKSEGFTLLFTLNPNIASEREAQTIVDLFDGILEIYEKHVKEVSKRFMRVKKMSGVKYSDTEILLERDRLF